MAGRHAGPQAAAAADAAAQRLLPDNARKAAGLAAPHQDECLKYLDTLFREYLLYRGLTSTLAAFNQELATEPTSGFQSQAVCDLIFLQLIPSGNLRGLLDVTEFLRARFYSRLDTQYETTIATMEASVLQLYVATHWRAGRVDLVSSFFSDAGELLLKGPSQNSWRPWFALPHARSVTMEPDMQVFFTAEWAELAEVSFRNFLSKVFATMPKPAVLRFNTLRQQRKELQRQVEKLSEENMALRDSLADADRAAGAKTERCDNGTVTADLLTGSQRQQQQQEEVADGATAASMNGLGGPGPSADGNGSRVGAGDGSREASTTDQFSDLSLEPQVLHGHQASVSVCRFSPGGEYVASGAADGTVRIWAPMALGGGRASQSRAASFQAGGPILSLDWDRCPQRSPRADS
mmetsp:Transcript_31285/g.88707  ORF Transcript_31285/g.88707 Transcript_31285/m.88707 type:complete len:407 (-) Transcript_31285:170-1390(-)